MRVLSVVAIILMGTPWLAAQQDQLPSAINDGFTPPSIAAGTPQGVYLLSPHEAVNYYSGSLDFSVPLFTVKGRGSAAFTVSLPIGWRWIIRNTPRSGQDVFAPVPSYAGGLDPAVYPLGFVHSREIADESMGVTGQCPTGTRGQGYSFYQGSTLTRLTWERPDGTETEFVDVTLAGSPYGMYDCTCDRLASRPNRGTVFASDDGTGMTFIADNPIYDWITVADRRGRGNVSVYGWLLFKDGTRYRFNDQWGVSQVIDRLGNTTTLSAIMGLGVKVGTAITDSLGRTYSITDNLQAGGAASYTAVYPAADGNTHTITANLDYLGNHLSSGNSLQTYLSLFPTTNAGSGGTFNPYVVSSIVLPDSSSYSFLYDSYAELTQATLPTGGLYQYDYPTTTPYCSGSNYAGCVDGFTANQNVGTYQGPDYQVVFRRVTARRVYTSSGTLEGQTCYSPTYSLNATVQVTAYDKTALPGCTSGNVLSSESHIYSSTPANDMQWLQSGTQMWYSPWSSGKEIQTIWANTVNGPALKTVNSLWEYNSPANLYTVYSIGYNATECLTLDQLGTNSAITSGKFFLYDKYFNTSDAYEYDFGSAPSLPSTCPSTAPTGFIRHSHTSYIADGVYDVVSTPASGPNSNHMRSLVNEADVYDGSGTLTAQTKYAYDETTLTSQTSPVGYTTPTHTKLGNPTSKSAWWNTNSSYWKTTYAYDNLGNILKITDPRSNATTISYADSCSTPVPSPPDGTLSVGYLYGFATKVTNALSQAVNIQYDCYLGKQKQFTDANSTVTNYSYSGDSFDRLLSAQRAVGRSEETHTTFSYPNLTTATTYQSQVIPTDTNIQTTALFDGLGRPSETRRYKSTSDYITVTQNCDGKGRPWQTSLPYSPTSGETAHYITTAYDGANRVVQVVADDGATTTTTYSGNVATTTDPAGAARVITTDGLGRVNNVVEDHTGLNYSTTYAYDVLDDLKTVTQSSETRAFTYNSLNQLVTATNPESGKICYGTMSGSTCTESYDGNGNLLKRTDARSIMTTYVYDVLNRVSSKSYSDGTTPNVAFTYDDTNVTCSKGRLTKGAAAATGSIPAVTTQTTSFDCLGRPTGTSETVGSNAYTYGYTYNLAGGQITETFPSGRVVTTTYDLLNRASGVTGLLSGTSSTYLKSVSYASSGAIAQLQYGATPLMKATTTFDQGLTTLREQPTGIAVTNTGGTGLLTLGYGFCPGQPAPAQCASNNGNVQSASIVAPGQSVNVWQNFNPTGSPYDKVNRLTKATETPQSGSNTSAWSQTYGYDAYGNRWVSANSGVPLSPFTPIASSNFPSNNQLQIGTTSYDLSGNQTAIGGYTNTFDGENRLTSSTLNSIKTTYTYDGSGQRVQKATAGGSTTTYVYDAAGDLTSELVSGTPPTNPCTTCYIASDTLGSTRLMMDASNGNLVALHDYLPFGEEIAGSPVRPGTLYGGTDNPRQKFTGKERDTESGLDYFGERYFSSAQGRFTSPDSMLAKKDWLVDPQRWNKYAYIRNNPLRYVDPNGEDLVVYYSLGNDVSDSDREWFNKNKAAILAAIQAKYEKAGVENVSLRDQSTLTKDQVAALDKNTPFGVARLTFVGKDYPGLGPAPMMGALGYENPDSKRVAAVFLDTFPKQPEAGCDWACIAANVGAHEVGHSLGMEHENTWESITEFFRVNVGGGSPDLMQGGQGVPRQPLDFYTGRDKTKRAIDELNKIGDMTPKKQ